jgi:uncharacterized protein (DUF983 family)
MRRCPVCGRGAVFRSHFRMNRECPSCHIVFWKDPGETLGAMYLDYAVAVGAFVICWVILVLETDLSDLAQFFVLGAVAASSVAVFYPFTRSLWTVLVYLSGGIDRPPIHVIRGRKRT